jgi:capsular polysaccharide biosynthesis protein
MELRQFWTVIRRRWGLVLVPALIVLILGLVTWRPSATSYNAGVRFIVGQQPGVDAVAADEQRYYNWLTSEYIVNGLTDWVRGGKFAEAVSEYLAGKGIEVPPGAIQGGLAADNARSMLTVSLNGGDPEMVAQMMDGVISVLVNRNAEALPQLGGETAVLVQLDEPVVNAVPGSLRSQLDLPLRLALALAVGFGLALLAEYLDPTVRDRRELERLGLPILGAIPAERGKRSRGTE